MKTIITAIITEFAPAITDTTDIVNSVMNNMDIETFETLKFAFNLLMNNDRNLYKMGVLHDVEKYIRDTINYYNDDILI